MYSTMFIHVGRHLLHMPGQGLGIVLVKFVEDCLPGAQAVTLKLD